MASATPLDSAGSVASGTLLIERLLVIGKGFASRPSGGSRLHRRLACCLRAGPENIAWRRARETLKDSRPNVRPLRCPSKPICAVGRRRELRLTAAAPPPRRGDALPQRTRRRVAASSLRRPPPRQCASRRSPLRGVSEIPPYRLQLAPAAAIRQSTRRGGAISRPRCGSDRIRVLRQCRTPHRRGRRSAVDLIEQGQQTIDFGRRR